MSEKAVERPEGSQSIVRAVELLSHVAARSEEAEGDQGESGQ